MRVVCLILAVSGLLFVLPATRADGVMNFTYAQVSGVDDPPLPYMQALLQLACDKAKTRCASRPALDMNQSRALTQMQKKDSGLDLFWGMTSRRREELALPVRVPLYKGLIGWRVALVTDAHSQLLAKVKTRTDLAAFHAGQAEDWPDTGILRNAGLPVLTTNDYGNLIPMLRHGRYDYFPRSVIEVRQEVRSAAAKGLIIDDHIAIHYPAAFYFFVSRHRPELASMLDSGLKAAVADGSFNQLFMRFNGEAIRELKLAKRVVIELDDPLLPEATPLEDKRLWFQP